MFWFDPVLTLILSPFDGDEASLGCDSRKLKKRIVQVPGNNFKQISHPTPHSAKSGLGKGVPFKKGVPKYISLFLKNKSILFFILNYFSILTLEYINE